MSSLTSKTVVVDLVIRLEFRYASNMSVGTRQTFENSHMVISILAAVLRFSIFEAPKGYRDSQNPVGFPR